MTIGSRLAPKVAPTVVIADGAQRCSQHRRYQVKRRPRGACDVCWLLWVHKLIIEGRW